MTDPIAKLPLPIPRAAVEYAAMSLSKIATTVVALVGLGVAATVADAASPTPTVSAAPAPAVTIGPDWTKATPQNGAAVRFERNTGSGTESISGGRRVCDCEPANAATMTAAAFKQISKAQTTITDTTMCGEPAMNLLVTGYATPQGGNNLDLYFLRMGDSLYTLTYAFRSDQPASDAVATLPALCPHSMK